MADGKTYFRVAVEGGWVGSAGYQCNLLGGVATSRAAFAACFDSRETAEGAAITYGGRVEAGRLAGFRFEVLA